MKITSHLVDFKITMNITSVMSLEIVFLGQAFPDTLDN
jgi:hypothetical protein